METQDTANCLTMSCHTSAWSVSVTGSREDLLTSSPISWPASPALSTCQEAGASR